MARTKGRVGAFVAAALALAPCPAQAAIRFDSRQDYGTPRLGDSSPHSVVAADFLNNDGLPDLAVSYQSTSVIVIYENGPPGTFTPVDWLVRGAPPASTVGDSPSGLVAVDFAGDALPDLLGVNTGDNRVTAYRNDTGVGGGFVASDPDTNNAQAGVRVVPTRWDFNASVDFVTCHGTGSIRIGLGNVDGMGVPDGTFAALNQTTRPEVGAQTDVEVADYYQLRPEPDVLTADNGNSQLVVWRGHPTLPGSIDDAGGMPAIVQVPTRVGLVAVKPVEILPGDYDGDFSPDALVVTEEGHALFFRNNGSATVFDAPGAPGTVTDLVAPRASTRQPTKVTAVRHADMNGDTVRDLVVADAGDATANEGYNWVSVIFGCSESPLPVFDVDGTACSLPPSHHAAGDLGKVRPGAIDVADLDLANGPDVVVVNGDSRSHVVSVFLNDGTGRLRAARSFPAGSRWPAGAASADLDADGAADVVVSFNPPAQVMDPAQHVIGVLLGDGAGGLGVGALQPQSGSFSPRSVSLGDLDGDGRLDVVSSHAADQFTWAGSGAGAFAMPRGAGGIVGEHRLGPLGGSAALDLAVVSAVAGRASTWRGDGARNFTAGQSWNGVNRYQDHLAASFFGAAEADIVIAAAERTDLLSPPAIFVIRWDPVAGSHGPLEMVPLPPEVRVDGLVLRRLASGDLDGDGTRDLLALSATGEVFVLLNDGTQLTVQVGLSGWSIGGDPRSVTLADLDSDGDGDLAAATADRVAVAEALGGGAFGAVLALGSNLSNDTLIAADVDGDLRPDLVVTSTNTNDVTVLRNQSTTPLIVRGTGAAPTSFSWLDQGPGATYDVVRGDLHALVRVERDTRGAACLLPEDRVLPQFTDAGPLPARLEDWAAWYYLVRCVGGDCTAPDWGTDSLGTPRVAGPAACAP